MVGIFLKRGTCRRENSWMLGRGKALHFERLDLSQGMQARGSCWQRYNLMLDGLMIQ